MELGIYPGGPVGTFRITDRPVPESPSSRLNALQALRAYSASGTPRPFVVRLYESYTGQPGVDSWSGSGVNATTDSEINSLSEYGFDIDLVVRYQPVSSLGTQAVDDYLAFVRNVVDRYGTNRNVKFLQIANEVNVTTSQQSSDGAFPGNVKALVWGVEVSAQEAAARGFRQLEVGFNWAYPRGTGVDQPLWRFIRSQGSGFRESDSWVGLDDYPGTFTDVPTPPQRTGPALVEGIARLRTLMRESGISNAVPIHISESGYPTGPNRSPGSQAMSLSSLVNSVNQVRGQYDVSDFEWFDLRDSNSSIQNSQEQYGLMADTYQPKTAFRTYKRLISEVGQ
jgi:hypothetical protein